MTRTLIYRQLQKILKNIKKLKMLINWPKHNKLLIKLILSFMIVSKNS